MFAGYERIGSYFVGRTGNEDVLVVGSKGEGVDLGVVSLYLCSRLDRSRVTSSVPSVPPTRQSSNDTAKRSRLTLGASCRLLRMQRWIPGDNAMRRPVDTNINTWHMKQIEGLTSTIAV